MVMLKRSKDYEPVWLPRHTLPRLKLCLPQVLRKVCLVDCWNKAHHVWNKHSPRFFCVKRVAWSSSTSATKPSVATPPPPWICCRPHPAHHEEFSRADLGREEAELVTRTPYSPRGRGASSKGGRRGHAPPRSCRRVGSGGRRRKCGSGRRESTANGNASVGGRAPWSSSALPCHVPSWTWRSTSLFSLK